MLFYVIEECFYNIFSGSLSFCCCFEKDEDETVNRINEIFAFKETRDWKNFLGIKNEKFFRGKTLKRNNFSNRARVVHSSL